MNTYYVDGEFRPENEATIPVTDLALLRGLGAFELLRTQNGKPFGLKEHLARLQASVDRIGIGLPMPLERISDIVGETLRRNQADGESNIRIIVTGGSSPDFLTPQGKPRLIVLVSNLPVQPEWWYTKGISIITVEVERAMTGAKSINYVDAAIAIRQAKEQGAVEAVYVDSGGLVREGTTSNVFIFIGDTLITPGEKILKGITRKIVLDLAAPLYPVEIRDIPLDMFSVAEEVFITGTNKGIVPVVTINGKPVSDGLPGHRTRQLMQRMKSCHP